MVTASISTQKLFAKNNDNGLGKSTGADPRFSEGGSESGMDLEGWG